MQSVEENETLHNNPKDQLSGKLKEQQELIDAIYTGLELPVFLIDVDEQNEFRFAGLNPAHEKLTGMKSEEIKGKTPEEIVPILPEEVVKAVRANYEKCLNKGKAIQYEEMIPFMGKESYWLTTLTPIRNHGSRIIRIVGTAISINKLKEKQTQLESNKVLLEEKVKERTAELEESNQKLKDEIKIRKSAEEELRVSEQKFRILFEKSPLGKSMTGVDGSLSVNKAFCDILGYTPDELKQKNWKEITHPDDIAQSEELVKDLLSGGKQTERFEKRYIHKKGHIVWTDVSTTLYRDNNGKPNFFITTISDITGRKEIEKELKLLTRRFELASEASDLAVWEWNAIEDQTIHNKQWEELYGIDKNEKIKTQWIDNIPSDDSDKVNKILEDHLNRKTEVYEVEHKYNHPTLKKQIWIHAKGKVVEWDENKKPLKMIGVSLDITARKQIEEELRLSTQRFKLASESSRLAVWEWNAQEDQTIGNKQWEELFGLEQPEKFENHGIENIPAEDAERLKKTLEDHFNGITDYYEVEHRYNHPILKKQIWIQTKGKVIDRDENNKPAKMICVSFDNNYREIAEKKLRHERFFSQKLTASTPAAIYVYNFKKGQNTFINQQYTAILGYTLEEINSFSNDKFMELFHPEDVAGIIGHMQAVMAGSENDKIEYRFKHKNGNWVWCYSIDSPFEKDDDGNVISFVGAFVDISDRKKVEQNLYKTLAELERSNKELEQFAYVASHDLQEPLRMVASYTQLLEKRYKDKLDQDASDFIDFAVQGSRRMQAMINDLLEYSRVATRQKPFREVNIDTLVKEVCDSLAITIEERNALITKEGLPILNGDESQLFRLFQNLIENAIKFVENNFPKINISAVAQDDEFLFAVKDNGIGINLEYKDKVFEIFQRLKTGSYHKGTGIGLAICKKIVQRHGGKIWVESNKGKGSTFYFTIKRFK